MRSFVLSGICAAVLLCGCASKQLNASFKPVLNTPSLVRLQRNMTPEEVVGLLGNPEKPILIYFYQNEGENSQSLRLSKEDSTPLVFMDNKLVGWGWNFLNGAAKNIMNN